MTTAHPPVTVDGMNFELLCSKCGEVHTLMDSNPGGLHFVRCSGKTFIVAMDGRGILLEDHVLHGSFWRAVKA